MMTHAPQEIPESLLRLVEGEPWPGPEEYEDRPAPGLAPARQTWWSLYLHFLARCWNYTMAAILICGAMYFAAHIIATISQHRLHDILQHPDEPMRRPISYAEQGPRDRAIALAIREGGR